MAFPAECPICKTVLTFPTSPSTDPVKCPACNSRFIIEGRRIAHLSYTDYYAFLGISPSADETEIKKAVRAKVLEHHPDRNPGDPAAADRLREVIQAKELLTDPEKRRIYDGVFNARPLPRWNASREEPVWHPEKDRASQYRAAPEARDSRYEEILSEARKRSRQASEENIDHLISEIEQILSSRGLGSRAAYKSRDAQALRSVVWGARGAIFLGGACFIIGLLRGSLLGATTLGFLGAIIGWMLGSNAGALASLIFLGARILISGLFLGIMISIYNQPSTRILLFEPFTSLTLMAVAGMLILGLYRIGVGAMSGKYRASLRFDVARSATLGAWLGGLARMSMVYAIGGDGGRSEAAALAWFILFSLYLLLDLNLFNRPIVVLY